jgi:1,2-phenylacetyl-CoA epoxidase catalytic subunit
MSGFSKIVQFFNSKKSNKIFTRAEYFAAMKNDKLKQEYLDTVRRYFCAAGYLNDFERGAYRKLKPIPQDLTISKLERQAYPNAKRFK